jgi:hypothetical protein
MSLKFDLVSHIMYLSEKGRSPQEMKRRSINMRKDHIMVTRHHHQEEGTDITYETRAISSEAFLKVEKSFEGYWCQGEECKCGHSHWVIHASRANCW